jgi:hypothetical protein
LGFTHIYHPSLNDLIALNFDAGNGWLQHVEKLLIIKYVLVAPGGPLASAYCKSRQARKGATVVEKHCAEIRLSGATSSCSAGHNV